MTILGKIYGMLRKFYQSNKTFIKIKEMIEYARFILSFKKSYSSEYDITDTSDCIYRQTYYNDKNKEFVSLCKQKDIKGIKEFYKESDGDKIYPDEYFENRMSMRIIARHICHNIPKDKSILDVACGHDAIDRVLSENGYKVTGIDFNPNRINALKNHIYHAACIDLDSMNEDIKYDVIISLEMLEHVPDILQSLKKIYDLLKGRGRLYMSVPNEFMIDDDQHIRIFNKNSLIKLMHQTGFHVISVINLPYINCEKGTDLVCVAEKRSVD